MRFLEPDPHPSFIGIIALFMFLPILIPVFVIALVRKVVLSVFEWVTT